MDINPSAQSPSSTTTSTETLSVTESRPGASQIRAWHDRASGELSSWGSTYKPTSESAAAIWRDHAAQIEPWIAATDPAGVTDARRVASAVLELLAWAMPRLDNLEACLTEEVLQQFLLANPNGIGQGSLANVRGRVRRVLRRVPAVGAGEVSAAQTVPASCDATGDMTRASDTTHPGSSAAGSQHDDQAAKDSIERADSETLPSESPTYDAREWAQLMGAAESDPVLAGVLAIPWRQPSPGDWQHAQGVARDLGIRLGQKRLSRTIHLRMLSTPDLSLGAALIESGMSRTAASEVAQHLPSLGENEYAATLRGECTRPVRRHPSGGPGTHGDDRRSTTPFSGGATMMSTVTPPPSPAAPVGGPIQPGARKANIPGRRRKPSARQARLAAAAARAEAQERGSSLPDSIRTYIRDSYRPLAPALNDWEHIKAAVEETLAASSVRGDDSMRKHVTHLAYFFSWAREAELPLAPSTLTRSHVGRYDLERLVAAGRSTRQNRRSRLLQMADQIHPDQAPIKGPPLAHRTVAAPYSLAEMAIVRRVAQVQPTALLTRQTCLLVGLGAGAGIDSTDLKRLYRREVKDHGSERGIEVRVTNLRRSKDGSRTPHCRTVWVLREYEDLVRIGLAGVPDDQLLLGRDAERANVAASIFDRAALHGEVPDLVQGRLRSTWISTHLQRSTPLNVLLRAAGLTTARTIVELLEFLPDPTESSGSLR